MSQIHRRMREREMSFLSKECSVTYTIRYDDGTVVSITRTVPCPAEPKPAPAPMPAGSNES